MSSAGTMSLVMPSFNHGHFIRDAIDSVLAQEGVHVDLLVMDGASTDDTVSILESYGSALRFVSEPDEGQSAAINEGMRRTTGEIVGWLNSDDRLHPGALAAVAEAFATEPEVEFVTGGGDNISEDGAYLADTGARPASLWELIHHRNSYTQPSCYLTRDLWNDVGGLDESLYYVMDWDLWIRCGCARQRFLDRNLSSNRTYPTNKTMSGGQARLAEIETMVRRYTTVEAPPVLDLYQIETGLQDDPDGADAPDMQAKLAEGMNDRLSGIDARGVFSTSFSVSLSPRRPGHQVGLELSPISRYAPSYRGAAPTELAWHTDRGDNGVIQLECTDQPQRFALPVDVGFGEVANLHVRCGGTSIAAPGLAETCGLYDSTFSEPAP